MQNVPRPTPLSGRGDQGTASALRTWRFTVKQRLDARASIQVVIAATHICRDLANYTLNGDARIMCTKIPRTTQQADVVIPAQRRRVLAKSRQVAITTTGTPKRRLEEVATLIKQCSAIASCNRTGVR